MAKKQMTIDDLAVMVQKGFQGVDKRLDGVDKRLDRIEDRLDGIDDHLEHIDGRLDRIEKIFSVDHKNRIERLEFEVKNLKDLFALK